MNRALSVMLLAALLGTSLAARAAAPPAKPAPAVAAPQPEDAGATPDAVTSHTITIDGQVLTVTQVAASQLSISTSGLNFGDEYLGVTAAQNLVVTNSGGSTLMLGDIAIGGVVAGNNVLLDFGGNAVCVAAWVEDSAVGSFAEEYLSALKEETEALQPQLL